MTGGTREELVALAARYLGVDERTVRDNLRELPEDSAFYTWEPVRGGGALVVGVDGSALFASSGVSPEEHLAAFRSGRRTDPGDFPS